MTRDWYRGLSEKEKNKKREYTRNRYQNMFEEDKRKLKDCKKNRICSMSWEELQQQREQLIEHMKELLKGLKNWVTKLKLQKKLFLEPNRGHKNTR